MDDRVGPYDPKPLPSWGGGGQGTQQAGTVAGKARDAFGRYVTVTNAPLIFTDWNPKRSRGEEAIEFIEAYCRIVKDSIGGRVGDLIHLREWQRELIRALLAEDERGLLRYRQALIGLPRKNGKSALSSSLALWALYTGPDGGEVYSVAGDKDQARITFDTAKRMVEMDPELSAVSKLFKDAIEHPESGSVWKVVSRDAPLKEGLSPTFTLFDEVHVQPDDSLWNVFSLAMGARPEPLMVGITTAGVKTDSRGQPSLCYGLYEYGREVAAGAAVDPTFYFAWWAAPERADHRDAKVWKAANPGFDDLVAGADFASAVLRTRENEFRTKRLNQWVSATTAWLPFGAWDALKAGGPPPNQTEIVLGFDGSWSNDSTGIVGCTLTEPYHLFVVDAWERKDNELDPDWHIDPEAVEQALRDACTRWTVRLIAFDPARWQDFYARLERDGLPVAEWPTNSVGRMVPACTEFEMAVLNGAVDPENRRLTHDGDPRLARHIENARLKIDARGGRIVKESKGSMRKIDLAVCAVIAYDTALRLPPRRESIYETRGFHVIGGEA